MTRLGIAAMAASMVTAGAPASAQRPAIMVDKDDITIRGCLTEARSPSVVSPSTLVWSRSDIMLAAAESMPDSAGLAGRVFYWLEDDDDLSGHVGDRVEIRGELEDFEKGKIKIDREGDYTKLELDLDGKKEKARVPTAWLSAPDNRRDQELDIVARRIDVKDVKVLGACR